MPPPTCSGAEAQATAAAREMVQALSSLRIADEEGGQCAATRASQAETEASLAEALSVLSAANAASRQQMARCAGLFARAAAAFKELSSDLRYIHAHSKKIKKLIYDRHPHLRRPEAFATTEAGPEEDGALGSSETISSATESDDADN